MISRILVELDILTFKTFFNVFKSLERRGFYTIQSIIFIDVISSGQVVYCPSKRVTTSVFIIGNKSVIKTCNRK